MRPLFSPYQREATVSDESDGILIGVCNGGSRDAATFPHLPQANHQSTQVSKTARPGAPDTRLRIAFVTPPYPK